MGEGAPLAGHYCAPVCLLAVLASPVRLLPWPSPFGSKAGDFERNDEVYDAIDDASKQAEAARQ